VVLSPISGTKDTALASQVTRLVRAFSLGDAEEQTRVLVRLRWFSRLSVMATTAAAVIVATVGITSSFWPATLVEALPAGVVLALCVAYLPRLYLMRSCKGVSQ